MPYVLISTQIRLECGPTLCGEENSDPALMNYLNATLQSLGGNPFKVYSTPDHPRKVLDRLADLGYRVVATSGVGQTCIWTLFADSPTKPPSLL
ncbi:GTP cyclohydrolase 1 feedback regulatory protein [Geodia barretti]|uniref:GTP cyclohydrolase 1 feedback regulatory protein n=1 Tax=Geodia barretti TaxID=519541 RepID=A0AA35W967_GEOBA|nr:GTP cyclohydrolase 1 feedback regulatory protein [Geodia barretti]